MIPIFTYDGSCERKDDGTFDVSAQILAHNAAAAALLAEPIVHSFVSDTPMYREFDLAEVLKLLPAMPIALVAPGAMLKHAMGADALQAIANEDRTHRTEDSVTAVMSISNGHLFVRATGTMVEMLNAELRFNQRRNGTILVVESYHEMDDATLDLDHAPFAADDDAEAIFEKFWSEINGNLEDPWLTDGDSYFDSEETEFTTGSQKALEEATEMLVCAWFAGQGKLDTTARIVYRANTEHDTPGLEEDSSEGIEDAPKALLKALRQAFNENLFAGSTCEYNDGAYARQSGYNRYGETVCVEVDPSHLTGHEMIAMAAQSFGAVTAWLKERKFTDAEIATICGTGKQAKKKRA